MNNNKILDEGDCGVAWLRGEEAVVKAVSPRTETFYKADAMGEAAVHAEACGSVAKVKNEVVQWKFMCLPGEVSIVSGAGLEPPSRHSGASGDGWIEYREVSRGHSSPEQRTGSSCPYYVWSEESRSLTQNEGLNLRCERQPALSLSDQAAVSLWKRASQFRSYRRYS